MPITINGTTGIAGVDGTASTPAMQGADTNTGVYYGSDTVYISTGGTLRATVDNTGLTLSTQLSVANGGTGLTSLTANRIPYASATNTLGTSANLTFDGTSLTLGASAARILGDFSTSTLTNRLMFQTTAANTTTSIAAIPSGTGISASWDAYSSTDVANASFGRIQIVGGTDFRIVSAITGSGSYLPMTFFTGGGEKLRLDASGNLGLGVTPSAWGNTKTLQIGVGSFSAYSNNAQTWVTSNAYYDGSSWRYNTTAPAVWYAAQGIAGAHVWYNAASGAAGSAISFTQAMTLEASGILLIGSTVAPATIDGVKIYARDSGNTALQLTKAGVVSTRVSAVTTGLAFGVDVGDGTTERARIDSSGNVVINTAAIATNATDGFLYVPTCAGTPTGTPTTYTGRAPIVVNTTNNKLYFYSGGAWRDAGP